MLFFAFEIERDNDGRRTDDIANNFPNDEGAIVAVSDILRHIF